MRSVVSVRVSTPDQFPYLVGVYRCQDCGGTVEQHGLHADEVPAKWVRTSAEDVLCPGCAAAKAKP